MPSDATVERKDAHLELCVREDVEVASPLFDCVHLVHCALPDLALEDINLRTRFFGKLLNAPLMVTGMTGGTERAKRVNLDLAQAAERTGVAFGLGSQRAMVEHPSLTETFSVREVAPTTVVLGNLGLTRAASMSVEQLDALLLSVGADGLAVHLNPAQELMQPEGDRNFRDGAKALTRLARHFGARLMVKETGSGISPNVARKLAAAGVRTIDVSGVGGTSWVRVEALRGAGAMRVAADELSGWGIPTAAALMAARQVVPSDAVLVASGGVRTGLDVAKAIALGADVCGLALPFFRAQQAGGADAVVAAIDTIVSTLRATMLLCGARDGVELRAVPRVVTSPLESWAQVLVPKGASYV